MCIGEVADYAKGKTVGLFFRNIYTFFVKINNNVLQK